MRCRVKLPQQSSQPLLRSEQGSLKGYSTAQATLAPALMRNPWMAERTEQGGIIHGLWSNGERRWAMGDMGAPRLNRTAALCEAVWLARNGPIRRLAPGFGGEIEHENECTMEVRYMRPEDFSRY